jgi:hypothetical protein
VKEEYLHEIISCMPACRQRTRAWHPLPLTPVPHCLAHAPCASLPDPHGPSILIPAPSTSLSHTAVLTRAGLMGVIVVDARLGVSVVDARLDARLEARLHVQPPQIAKDAAHRRVVWCCPDACSPKHPQVPGGIHEGEGVVPRARTGGDRSAGGRRVCEGSAVDLAFMRV